MKLANHVTLELFVRPDETAAALDALIPIKLDEICATQWHRHPTKERTKVYEMKKRDVLLLESVMHGDDGEIIVLVCRFSKQRDTEAFLRKLHEMDADDLAMLKENIDGHLNEDDDLVLKLNRKAAELGLVKLGKGIVVRINLAAFPKNKETCREIARKALG